MGIGLFYSFLNLTAITVFAGKSRVDLISTTSSLTYTNIAVIVTIFLSSLQNKTFLIRREIEGNVAVTKYTVILYSILLNIYAWFILFGNLYISIVKDDEDQMPKSPYPNLTLLSLLSIALSITLYFIKMAKYSFKAGLNFIYWVPTRIIYDFIYAIANLDDDERLKNWVDNLGFVKLYNKILSFIIVLIWLAANIIVFYFIGAENK